MDQPTDIARHGSVASLKAQLEDKQAKLDGNELQSALLKAIDEANLEIIELLLKDKRVQDTIQSVEEYHMLLSCTVANEQNPPRTNANIFQFLLNNQLVNSLDSDLICELRDEIEQSGDNEIQQGLFLAILADYVTNNSQAPDAKQFFDTDSIFKKLDDFLQTPQTEEIAEVYDSTPINPIRISIQQSDIRDLQDSNQFDRVLQTIKARAKRSI